jgi:hypothetical protein
VEREYGRRNGALLTILHKPREVDQEIILTFYTHCFNKELHVVQNIHQGSKSNGQRLPSTTSYLTVFRKRQKMVENGIGNDESITGCNIDRTTNTANRNTAELSV